MHNKSRGFGLVLTILLAAGLLTALATTFVAEFRGAQESVRRWKDTDTAVLQSWACVTYALRFAGSATELQLPVRLYGPEDIWCEIYSLAISEDKASVVIHVAYGVARVRVLAHAALEEGLWGDIYFEY